jgi:hypothetical protein
MKKEQQQKNNNKKQKQKKQTFTRYTKGLGNERVKNPCFMLLKSSISAK